MNKKLFLSFVGISLCISFILGAAIIVGIRSLNESGEGRIRYPALRFLARFVEHEQNNQVALGRFEAMRKRLGLKTRPVWILDGNGHVIAETPLSLPLPPPWRSLTKPLPIHRVLAHYQPFHLTPDYMAIRLDSTIPTFLLLRTSTSKSFNRFILGQAALLFTTMAASALAGLAVTFAYLRYKSREAKTIMGRLEKGDLKARFPLTRLDEAGSLINDFNRMARAIERLVRQAEETDTSRKELLQELGHDLKTPMTSLRTAVDTIMAHRAEMSPNDLDHFFRVIQAESHYFLRMTADLFLIAEIGEPRWGRKVDTVNLSALLAQETEHARRNSQAAGKSVTLNYVCDDNPIIVSGDALLLRRLIRNALGNALRFAGSTIDVTFDMVIEEGTRNTARIRINDDGPGIAPEDALSFGKRRNRRMITDDTVSMGLGSVIMATIVRAYGGKISIRNLADPTLDRHGSALQIELPAGEQDPVEGLSSSSIIFQ